MKNILCQNYFARTVLLR